MHVFRISLVVALVATLMPALIASADHDPRHEFYNRWVRTDAPVAADQVSQTWMWGPGPYSEWLDEKYDQGDQGQRFVQYFDKSRMEINDPNGDPTDPWYVTNGLLAQELITGRIQVADAKWEQHEPSREQVAGDHHPDSPTYALLQPLLDWEPTPFGWTIVQQLHSDGSVTSDEHFGQYGVSAQAHVEETNHTIASVFWEFMNATSVVYENDEYGTGQLFENPFFATGYPITEPYWVNVPVGGLVQDVLVQCFERRCMTYTPGNDEGWKVEAGNIGQHAYKWRYGGPPAEIPARFNPPAPSQRGLGDQNGCVNINTADYDDLWRITHIGEDHIVQIIELREQQPFTSVEDLTRVNGIGDGLVQQIIAEGIACV